MKDHAKAIRDLGMDPLHFIRDLHDELHGQLCCAWEEIAEQHAEMDEADDRQVLKAIKQIHFDGNHIVVIDKAGEIHHHKFTLERVA